MEESNFKSKLNFNDFVEKLLRDMDNACEQFIQEYADKYDLSFECAEKFLQKYYDITIGVEVTDDYKCYITFISKLKPIEEILDDTIDLSITCEKELGL